ncbi:hypothetical protein HAX54_021761, partial [Datura stramonium]|nr:hypothetical protein [Datura stramonium]
RDGLCCEEAIALKVRIHVRTINYMYRSLLGHRWKVVQVRSPPGDAYGTETKMSPEGKKVQRPGHRLVTLVALNLKKAYNPSKPSISWSAQRLKKDFARISS